MIGANKTLSGRGWIQIAAGVVLSVVLVGCGRASPTVARPPDATLSIGYGENPEAGIRQTVRNIALEGLIRIDSAGRPQPWLAERWSVSADGLTWRLQLRSGATFHDGQPATAAVVGEILQRELPKYLGPAFDDVELIRAASTYELEFMMRRRSTFLLEGLDVPIQRGEPVVGTGPFSVATQLPGEIEMRANMSYYGGHAAIDRILFRSYDSVRAAWADMLRSQVDMLYEVGVDALDSLSGSSRFKIFPFQRPYAFIAVLNVRSNALRDKAVRRAINAAVDRGALVAEALDGNGTPADGPVWPNHWAYSDELPRFTFLPTQSSKTVRFSCLLLADQAHERIGLVLQRQLRAVGVEVAFEQVTPAGFVARLESGDFDAALADYRLGPSILQQYLLWHSKGPNSWGNFSSPPVDAALEAIRDARDDASYKAGVVELQRAIVDDPPAIFLAWGERMRAVSTRFDVHSEPGRDVLSAPLLRLWEPVANGRTTNPN